MRGKRKIYTPLQLLSAVFMILALLWLTVSAPFVASSKQQIADTEQVGDIETPLSTGDGDNTNPFGNNTEEKSPGSTSFSEEYLHDHHKSEGFFSVISNYHKLENAGTYVAFHGELLVPPPNQPLS